MRPRKILASNIVPLKFMLKRYFGKLKEFGQLNRTVPTYK